MLKILQTAVIVAVALSVTATPPGFAQEPETKIWSHKELGISVSRPADLYELDPEPPADDITGEVEWGPKDHAWTILVTSQKPNVDRTLAAVAAEIKRQQPQAEIAEAPIGDGIAALRVVLLDSDSLTAVAYFFDRSGTTLIAIELAISLTEEDSGKDVATLKAAHAATIALFERLIGSVRFTAK